MCCQLSREGDEERVQKRRRGGGEGEVGLGTLGQGRSAPLEGGSLCRELSPGALLAAQAYVPTTPYPNPSPNPYPKPYPNPHPNPNPNTNPKLPLTASASNRFPKH